MTINHKKLKDIFPDVALFDVEPSIISGIKHIAHIYVIKKPISIRTISNYYDNNDNNNINNINSVNKFNQKVENKWKFSTTAKFIDFVEIMDKNEQVNIINTIISTNDNIIENNDDIIWLLKKIMDFEIPINDKISKLNSLKHMLNKTYSVNDELYNILNYCVNNTNISQSDKLILVDYLIQNDVSVLDSFKKELSLDNSELIDKFSENGSNCFECSNITMKLYDLYNINPNNFDDFIERYLITNQYLQNLFDVESFKNIYEQNKPITDFMNKLIKYGYNFNINKEKHILYSIITKHYEATINLITLIKGSIFINNSELDFPLPIEYIILSNLTSCKDTSISDVIRPILTCLSDKVNKIKSNNIYPNYYTLSYLITSINSPELLFDALIYNILTVEDMFTQHNTIIGMNYNDLLYYLDLLYNIAFTKVVNVQLSYDNTDPYHIPHNDLITHMILITFQLISLENKSKTNEINIENILQKIEELLSIINIKIEEKFINYLLFQYRKLYIKKRNFNQKFMNFSVSLFEILLKQEIIYDNSIIYNLTVLMRVADMVSSDKFIIQENETQDNDSTHFPSKFLEIFVAKKFDKTIVCNGNSFNKFLSQKYKMLMQPMSELYLNDKCMVCLDKKEILCYGDICGHAIMCIDCYSQISNKSTCPMCNTKNKDYKIVKLMY